MLTYHESFMNEALKEAQKAFKMGEAPIGAVIVKDGKIIARAHNLKEKKQDATSHAEIEVIRIASEVLGAWRLDECSMYVTLEPCPMCAGAIIQARVPNLYIGAMDRKAGAAGSVVDLFRVKEFNHQVDVAYGVLFEPCGEILTKFFKERR